MATISVVVYKTTLGIYFSSCFIASVVLLLNEVSRYAKIMPTGFDVRACAHSGNVERHEVSFYRDQEL